MTKDTRVGLDLGQASDYSAMVVVERQGEGRQSIFEVRFARRWRGVSYPVLVAEAGRILASGGRTPVASRLNRTRQSALP